MRALSWSFIFGSQCSFFRLQENVFVVTVTSLQPTVVGVLSYRNLPASDISPAGFPLRAVRIEAESSDVIRCRKHVSVEQLQLLDFVAVDHLNAVAIFLEPGASSAEITGVNLTTVEIKPGKIRRHP